MTLNHFVSSFLTITAAAGSLLGACKPSPQAGGETESYTFSDSTSVSAAMRSLKEAMNAPNPPRCDIAVQDEGDKSVVTVKKLAFPILYGAVDGNEPSAKYASRNSEGQTQQSRYDGVTFLSENGTTYKIEFTFQLSELNDGDKVTVTGLQSAKFTKIKFRKVMGLPLPGEVVASMTCP